MTNQQINSVGAFVFDLENVPLVETDDGFAGWGVSGRALIEYDAERVWIVAGVKMMVTNGRSGKRLEAHEEELPFGTPAMNAVLHALQTDTMRAAIDTAVKNHLEAAQESTNV